MTAEVDIPHADCSLTTAISDKSLQPDKVCSSRSSQSAVDSLSCLAYRRAHGYTTEQIVEVNFGLSVKPGIVAVLLASLREREALKQSKRKALVAIERAKAEQPELKKSEKKRRKKSRIDKEAELRQS